MAPSACVRCRTGPGEVQVREARYCAACYARVFDEKLRPSLDLLRGAVLWHSVVAPAQTSAAARAPAWALAFSGSAASCALLHAMYRVLHDPSAARGGPARTPELARIDVLYVGSASGAAAARDVASAIAPDAAFVALDMVDAYTGHDAECRPAEHFALRRAAPQAPASALAGARAALLGAPRSGAGAAHTRIEDLERILRQRVLHRCARERQCAALVWADDASDAAAFIMAALAKGAGHKLPIEGAAALWVDDVLYLHPLRQHLPHELTHYTHEHDVPVLAARPAPAPAAPALCEAPTYEALADKYSIGRLATSLITVLQHGVSSTSSTVVGTASKLVVADERARAPKRVLWPTEAAFPRIGAKAESLVRAAQAVPLWRSASAHACVLCRYPAQPGAAQWKAARSMALCDDVLDVPAIIPLPLDVLALFEGAVDDVPDAVPLGVLAPSSGGALDGVAPAAPAAAHAEPHAPRASHAPQRVAADELRRQVAAFLLDE